MYVGQRPCRRSPVSGAIQAIAAVTLLATGLVVTACSVTSENSSGGGSSASSTTGTVVNTASTPTSSSGSSSGSSASGSSDSGSGSESTDSSGVAWVPFGPDDPKFPTPGWDVYYYFLAHNCNALQSDVQTPDAGFGSLYDAAVAVCRAAVDGEQGQWSVAAAAFDKSGGGAAIGPASCVDETISTMVATLLAWHDQHPGQQPDLTFPQTPDGRTACSRDNNSIAGPAPQSSTIDSTTTTPSTEFTPTPSTSGTGTTTTTTSASAAPAR